MPITKKESVEEVKADVPKASRKKAPAKPKAAPKKAAPVSKAPNVEKRLAETEERLRSLISILYNDLVRDQRGGPRGLASKIAKAGLLDK